VHGCAVERVLGQSAIAVVYLARRGDDLVVVKVSAEAGAQAAAALERERRLLERIGPPIVPAVLESGALADERRFLVMEYVPWPTLADHRRSRGGTLPPDEVIAVGRVAAAALGAVHAAGLVHRDVKPDNILVGDPLAAKLLDFGIAERAGGAAQVKADAGTVLYMSPEQCEASAWIGPEADVYGLGAVLYELLTGAPPFSGPAAAAIMQAHIALRLPRFDGPPALVQVIRRCLAKRPGDRFADAAQLAEALGRAGAPAAPGHLDAASRTMTASRVHTGAHAAGSAPAGRTARRMAVVYLSSTGAGLDVGRLSALAASFGGQLAHVAGARAAVVLDPDRGKAPVERAVAAARQLADGLGTIAAVDFAAIEIRRRGARTRLACADFDDASSYADRRGPGGVLLTARAAAASQVATRPVAETRWHELVELDPVPIDLTFAGEAREHMVGRADLLVDLLAAARAAFAESQPAIASVVGDAGQGKSLACAALLRRLPLEVGAELVALAAPEPLAGGDTSASLHRLIASCLRLAPSPARAGPAGAALTAERALPALSALLGPARATAVWPVVGHALGEVPDDDPVIRRLAASPGAVHDALVVAVGSLVRERARRRPLAVVLDDAQFADTTTLDALEYAALAESRAPLWVCTFARPAFDENRVRWGERAARRLRREIGSLPPGDAASLCRELLRPAESVPESAIQVIVARAAGVPLLLVELVRGLKAAGLVRPRPTGTGWYVATDEIDAAPDAPLLDWLAERELARLDPALARYCPLLALLGNEFDRAEVEEVVERLGQGEGGEGLDLDPGVATRRLAREGLLVEERGGRMRFRHALTREAIERAATGPLRAQVHEAALQVHRGRADRGDLALHKRAHHAERCGEKPEAAALYLELAERAAYRHAYVEAERMYSRCLAVCDDEPARSLAARRGRGLTRYRIGRHGDALDDLEAGLGLAHAAGQNEAEAHILLDQSTVLDWMSQFQRSRERVDRARELTARAGTTPLLEARICLGVGRAWFRLCDMKVATSWLLQAIEQVEPLGDDGYETLVISLLLLSITLTLSGDLERAEAMVERLVGTCEQRNDRLHLASALANRRVLLVAAKRVDQIVADGERCLAIARELGLAELEYVAAYNLAEALYLADDPAAAGPHLDRALDLERHRPPDETRPVAALLELRMLTHRGSAEAGTRLRAVGEQQERAVQAGNSDAVFLPHERALYEMVELTLAEQHDPDAWPQLRQRIAQHAMEQEPIELAEFESIALERRGRVAEAREALDRATALLATLPSIMDRRLARQRSALAARPIEPAR
jgi:eukaryotic-like serine/threonine-protein kinase